MPTNIPKPAVLEEFDHDDGPSGGGIVVAGAVVLAIAIIVGFMATLANI